MWYTLNANLHRLFLHTGWDNLWNDAWRHQNRLRTSISGEFEKLTLVTNSSDQPAKHPRSNIRLGKEGAEAGEPHWGAQQGGWPKWRWSVLDGHLTFPLLPFYVKIFLLDKVCLVLSFKLTSLCLKTSFVRSLHLVPWHSFWILTTLGHHWSQSQHNF